MASGAWSIRALPTPARGVMAVAKIVRPSPTPARGLFATAITPRAGGLGARTTLATATLPYPRGTIAIARAGQADVPAIFSGRQTNSAPRGGTLPRLASNSM